MGGPKGRRASFLAVLSGSLLLAGHFSGASRWQAVIDTISGFIEVTLFLRYLFLAIIVIASAGGASVILGGLMILEGRVLLARLLILLGTGFGLVSFLMVLSLAVIGGDLPMAGGTVVVLIGIGLSILARFHARD
ncbi:MAG: hypothetical protein ACE5HJ_01890 [Thermoplasmata archaeon]